MTRNIQPGDLLADRYRIEMAIGQGSFGRVFRATDTTTNQWVALKEFVKQPGRNDGFLRELGVLFELSHPNIIGCDSVAMSGHSRFLVYEYMNAGSLRDLLEIATPDPRRLLKLLVQASQGVEHAHRSNVLHRDLKPENILLARSEAGLVAKVSDFGISTISSSIGQRAAIGSPAYMAPEQFYDSYDVRVDVYALGVILYEILCSRRPFYGSPAQIMMHHVKRSPEIPSWLPHSFAMVLRRALAKEPERRFDSAAKFSSALRVAIVRDGDKLEPRGWPASLDGITQLATTREAVYAIASGRVYRYDLAGRLLAEEPGDDVWGAEQFSLIRDETTLRLRSPFWRRTFDDVPTAAKVALSAEGSVAFCHNDKLVAINAGIRETLREDIEVTDICFVGEDQALCTVTNTPTNATLRINQSDIEVPEPICEVFGHSAKPQMLARSARDSRRLFLIKPGRLTAVTADCTRFSCDGQNFIGATKSGAIATVSVGNARIATTHWDSPIAVVSATRGNFAWATQSGRLRALN